MGAIIDPGNPVVPFVGGFVVGMLVGAPVMDMVGQMFMGGGESDSGVAYAYHGGMHRHGRHMMGHGMMHGGGRGPMRPLRRHMMPIPGHRAVARSHDFEKEYGNVEQTYSNHMFINDHKSSV